MNGTIRLLPETGTHKPLVDGSNPATANYCSTHSDPEGVNAANLSHLFTLVINIQ
jgi:hypothetical protein